MSKIRHYRTLAGMTQAELAEAADAGTGGAIANYEAGSRRPDVHTLVRIRDALRAKKVKVALEDLIDDQQPNTAA